jgi:hypothetical protein
MATAHPTLTDLRDELRRGGVVEADVHDAREHIHGLCYPDGRIIVSPKAKTVETLLHELTHRQHPGWGEARVQRETAYVLRRMSDEDVASLYRLYRRMARKARKPITVIRVAC